MKAKKMDESKNDDDEGWMKKGYDEKKGME